MLLNGFGLRKNEKKALEQYRLAAEKGGAYYKATFALILRHWTENPDPDEAVAWMTQAAELGDSEAAYTLGALYATGEDVEIDAEQAVRWYWMAAEAGHAEAKYNLGFMYCRGVSVPKDTALGRSLLFEAAHEGDILAMDLVADASADGLLGFPKDDEKARYWRERYRSETDNL